MGTEPLEFCAAARLESSRAREGSETCIFVDLFWWTRVVASDGVNFNTSYGRSV